MSQKHALVIGAGAFGTSIATVLANNYSKVILLARSDDVYQGIKNQHENTVYLPGAKLPTSIKAAQTWDEALKEASLQIDLLVCALPTHAVAPFFKTHHGQVLKCLEKGTPLISLTKGIDPETLELPDDLFFDFFPLHRDQICFLSGPSFAREIIQEQITLVSLAGRSKKVLLECSRSLEANYFKALPNYDIKGVLLGGALKNVLAIAGGIVEGLGFNHNTRAAMITRAIAEMLRFGKVFNARPETFYGLSGMGDLILTTTGETSRNKQFGLELARGRSPEDIINSQRTVVEGHKTAKAAYLLAQKYDIHASIFKGAYQVLYEGADPQNVIKTIMATPTRFELE